MFGSCVCRDEAEETYEDEFEEEEQDAEQLEAGKAPVEMLVLTGRGMVKAMLQKGSCKYSLDVTQRGALSLKPAKIKMICLAGFQWNSSLWTLCVGTQ